MEQMEKEQGLELRIERQFNVEPEVVFDAFTKPEAMRVWWTEETSFDIDLREGGRWTITREADGTEYTMTGEYLEIARPHRLKYTIAMPQFSPNTDVITIDITPTAAGCSVTFVQSGVDITSELREFPPGTVSESEKGWHQGFDLMEAAWAKAG
jgi:uncharacterized protein YndB with AHSA1/START domain